MGAGLVSGECSEQDTVNISQNDVSAWLYTPVDVYMSTVAMPIVWSLCLVINFTFLFVMFRVPKARSDTNIYLAHLAVSDLLYTTLAFAFRIWGYLASPVARHVPFQHIAGCIAFSGTINTIYHASIILVTAVTFERYLALCHPIKHLGIRGRKRTNKMIALCWLLSVVMGLVLLPTAIGFQVRCLRWPDDDTYLDYPSSFAYCTAAGSWAIDYAVPIINLFWLILLLASIYMYVRIVLTLNQRTGKNGIASNDPQAIHTRNQVAKMLIVNGVVFFLCQTPYRIFSFSRWICSIADIPDPLATLGNANWIGGFPQYINTLVNPLIYGAINTQYRKAFREAFWCKSHSTSSALRAKNLSKFTSTTRL